MSSRPSTASTAIPAELVLIGDGPERGAAEARVRALGLSDAVRFTGRQERFAHILRGAAAFLLPSESESFGVAALEAMSCGVPVVASRVGGLPELVEHAISGYLEPVGAIDAFAAAILKLITSPETWTRYSQAARARAVSRFSQSDLIDRYEALYREVLAS